MAKIRLKGRETGHFSKIDRGKVGDEILLLWRQLVEIPRKAGQGNLKNHHVAFLLFNTDVQY